MEEGGIGGSARTAHSSRHTAANVQDPTRLDIQLGESATALGGRAEVVGLSPDGRGQLEAHVTVPNEWLAALPPLTDADRAALEDIAPYVGRKCAVPAAFLRICQCVC